MRIELKAPLNPSAVFLDDRFIFKNKEYPYCSITSFKQFSKPSPLTNGVIQIVVNAKTITITYANKQKEEGNAVLDLLDKVVHGGGVSERSKDEMARNLYYECVNKGYGKGFNETNGVAHFRILVENLIEGEEVLLPFIGIHNYVSATKHDHNFAYAVTNKRILMAQKKVIGQQLHTVAWENINDIKLKTGVAFGIVTVDTYREEFNIAIDKGSAATISGKLQEIFDGLKSQSRASSQIPVQVTAAAPAVDPYAEIKKAKELLDMGILSQEEFEQKKKQLLGL